MSAYPTGENTYVPVRTLGCDETAERTVVVLRESEESDTALVRVTYAGCLEISFRLVRRSALPELVSVPGWINQYMVYKPVRGEL